MAAATDSEVRTWLREQGEDVPARARIRKELRDKYDAAHDDPGDDYAGPVGADPGDAPDMAENAPRTPRTTPRPRTAAPATSAATRARQLWSRARDAGKPAKGKKARPWVSTADVIEHLWSQLAWAARPMPPVQKILAAQAPMAGILLQDAARDTFIDRVILQPAARAEHRLQAANAMLGPPMWTFAIASVGGAVQDPASGLPLVDADGQYVWDDRTRLMIGGLRFSLMSWLKVGGKRVEEITAAAEELTHLGDQADELIAWILAPPVPGKPAKETEREAQEQGTAFISGRGRPGYTRGEHDGLRVASPTQDDVTAHLEQMAAGSALRPAPAGTP